MLKSFFYTTFLFIFSFFLLWLANRRKKYRYRQVWSPFGAMVFSLAVLVIYANEEFFNGLVTNLDFFNTLKGQWDALGKFLESFFNGFHSPKAEVFSLELNIAVIGLFLFFKTAIHLLAAIALIVAAIARLIKRLFKKGKEPVAKPKRSYKEIFFAYVADPEREDISLQDDWDHGAKFGRRLGVFAFLILIGCIFSAYLEKDVIDSLQKVVFLPKLPVLPVLLLLEAAWYLGGPRYPKIKPDFVADRAKGDRRGTCEQLWERYKEIWPERVLAASRTIARVGTKITENFPGDDPLLNEDQKIEIEIVAGRLFDKGFELDADQANMLEALWRRRDVLISESIYEKANPVLFSALQRDITQGRNIVFLIQRNPVSEIPKEIETWIEKWINYPIYEIKNPRIASLKKFKRTENILVTSVKELLHHDMNADREWFENLSTVVVVNIPEVIFPDLPGATALFHVLSDQAKKFDQPLHLILLSPEKRSNMESSVRDCLTSTPAEFNLSTDKPADICYVIWRSEGKDPFQMALLDNCPQYAGPGSILAIPALQESVKSISLTGACHEPWREYIEEMDILIQGSQKRAKDVLNFHAYPYTASSEEFAFVISHDIENNLVNTLSKSMAFGKNGVTVHVVSRAYLLRDYFAANIEFFIRRRTEAFAMMAPTLMKTPATVAYYLKERLLVNSLSDDDINWHLNRIEFNPESFAISENWLVEDRLSNLFLDVFGVDLRSRLNVDSQYRLNSEKKYFEKSDRIQLRTSIKEALHDDIEDNFRVTNPAGKTLEIIPAGRVYQKYLPGQFHAFSGKLFRIVAIDNEARRVITQNVPTRTKGCLQYRHIDMLILENLEPYPESIFQEIIRDRLLIRSLNETSFGIKNCGYFSFSKGINFSEGMKLVKLDHNETPFRKYDRGRMLELEIRMRNETAIVDADKISFTLACLLNELFVSVFPENHIYLKACTPHFFIVKEDTGKDNCKKTSSKISGEGYEDGMEDSSGVLAKGGENVQTDSSAVSDEGSGDGKRDSTRASGESGKDGKNEKKPDYSISEEVDRACTKRFSLVPEGFDSEDHLYQLISPINLKCQWPIIQDDRVYLYIFEDSPVDMGLAKTLYDNIYDIFDILYDYLTWYMEETEPENGFLSFGTGKIHEGLLLNETRDFLADLVIDLPLHTCKFRKYFNSDDGKKISEFPGGVENICDFCGKRLSSLDYETLDDGRLRCDTCERDSVNSQQELEKLYSDTRKWISQRYRLKNLRQNVSVTITGSDKIHKHFGIAFKPTPGFDPRPIGFAEKASDGYAIFIENGQPRHMILATMAHELTHIWQFDNLDMQRLQANQGKLLSEGHAKWVELDYLRKKNIGHIYSKYEKSRDDEYGRGFRLIDEMLKDRKMKNPFEMLLIDYSAN